MDLIGRPQQIDYVNVKTYGAKGDGVTNDSTAIAAAQAVAGSGTIFFPDGTYIADIVVSTRINIIGTGSDSVTIISTTSSGSALTLQDRDTGWNPRLIKGITFARGSGGDTRIGVRFGGNSYVTNDEWTGRYTFEDCKFTAWCGILKQDGNIGNRFYNCQFSCAKYNYYAYNRSGATMHSGNDEFFACHQITAISASMYINMPTNTGYQTILHGGIIEYVQGFGIYIKNYAGNLEPGVILDSVVLEGTPINGTANISDTGPSGSETNYPTVEIYAENCGMLQTKNCDLRSVKLVASRLIATNAGSNGADSITADSDSMVIIDGASVKTTSTQGQYASSIRSMTDTASATAGYFRAPSRRVFSHQYSSVALLSEPFARKAGGYNFPSSTSANAVSDGRIFDRCVEVIIPATTTSYYNDVAFPVVASGKYVVWTFDGKITAGGLTWLKMLGTGQLANIITLDSQWRTFAGIAKTTGSYNVTIQMLSTGAGATVRLSAWQLLQFDSLQEATEYLDGGFFTLPLGEAKPYWLEGSATIDPPNLAATSEQTLGTTITVTGAALGDYVVISAPYDLQGCIVFGYVSAANTVTIRQRNGTAGAIDLASGTWRARVMRQGP